MKRTKGLRSIFAWLMVITLLLSNNIATYAMPVSEGSQEETTETESGSFQTQSVNHNVTFLDADGNELSSVEVAAGSVIDTSSIPELSDNNFWGWYEADIANRIVAANTQRNQEIASAYETISNLSEEEALTFDYTAFFNSIPDEYSKEEANAIGSAYGLEEAVNSDVVLRAVNYIASSAAGGMITPFASQSGDHISLDNGDTITFTSATAFNATGISSGTYSANSYITVAAGASVDIVVNPGVTANLRYIYGEQATVTFSGAGKLTLDNGYSNAGTALTFGSLVYYPTNTLALTGIEAGAVIKNVIMNGANVDFKGLQSGLVADNITIDNNTVANFTQNEDDATVDTLVGAGKETGRGATAFLQFTIQGGANVTAAGYNAGLFSKMNLDIDNATVHGETRTGGNLGGIYSDAYMTITNGANVTGECNTVVNPNTRYGAGIVAYSGLEISGSTTIVNASYNTDHNMMDSFAIWVNDNKGDGTKGSGLVIDGATVNASGGAETICVGIGGTHPSGSISASTVIRNGATVTISLGTYGNVTGFSSNYLDSTVSITDSALISISKYPGTYTYGRAIWVSYLTLNNAYIEATNKCEQAEAIRIGFDYSSTNSTVVAKIETEVTSGKYSIRVVRGKYYQSSGTFDGIGGMYVNDADITLEDSGKIDIATDRTGIITYVGDLVVNGVGSAITIVGNDEIDALVGTNIAGDITVTAGSISAVNAKEVGVLAAGHITAKDNGTITGACTDEASLATHVGGVVSSDGNITAENGTINGTTVHAYSDSHAAVHAKGGVGTSKTNGAINEYYTKQFESIYQIGYKKAYSDIGLSIDSANFDSYDWTAHTTSWANTPVSSRVDVTSNGLKAITTATSEHLIASSKTAAINNTNLIKDATSAHNVHFIVALAASNNPTLSKQVGIGATPSTYGDDIYLKEIKANDIFTYKIEATMPATGTTGYTSLVISDTLPTNLPLNSTSPLSVIVEIAGTTMSLSGNDVTNGGTVVGNLSYSSGKLELKLNAAGITLLNSDGAKVAMYATVKATAAMAEGDTVTNKADISVNGDTPIEEESIVGVIEMPDNLEKKVKNGSGSYVETIAIEKGAAATLDYQIKFDMPDSSDGYESFVVVDEAPSGTTFTGTPSVSPAGVPTPTIGASATLLRIDFTAAQVKALEGQTITLTVSLSVPAAYTASTITNKVSYWVNPSTAGNTDTKPGGNPDDTKDNVVNVYPKVTYNKGTAGTATINGTVPVDNNLYQPLVLNGVSVIGNTGSLSAAGYKFAGWKTSEASGTIYKGADTFTMPNANVTLTAVWAEIPSGTFEKLVEDPTDNTYKTSLTIP
ncbi:MAG: beta strand repeat-containing protein [Suipraeoptans sp.]